MQHGSAMSRGQSSAGRGSLYYTSNEQPAPPPVSQQQLLQQASASGRPSSTVGEPQAFPSSASQPQQLTVANPASAAFYTPGLRPSDVHSHASTGQPPHPSTHPPLGNQQELTGVSVEQLNSLVETMVAERLHSHLATPRQAGLQPSALQMASSQGGGRRSQSVVENTSHFGHTQQTPFSVAGQDTPGSQMQRGPRNSPSGVSEQSQAAQQFVHQPSATFASLGASRGGLNVSQRSSRLQASPTSGQPWGSRVASQRDPSFEASPWSRGPLSKPAAQLSPTSVVADQSQQQPHHQYPSRASYQPSFPSTTQQDHPLHPVVPPLNLTQHLHSLAQQSRQASHLSPTSQSRAHAHVSQQLQSLAQQQQQSAGAPAPFSGSQPQPGNPSQAFSQPAGPASSSPRQLALADSAGLTGVLDSLLQQGAAALLPVDCTLLFNVIVALLEAVSRQDTVVQQLYAGYDDLSEQFRDLAATVQPPLADDALQQMLGTVTERVHAVEGLCEEVAGEVADNLRGLKSEVAGQKEALTETAEAVADDIQKLAQRVEGLEAAVVALESPVASDRAALQHAQQDLANLRDVVDKLAQPGSPAVASSVRNDLRELAEARAALTDQHNDLANRLQQYDAAHKQLYALFDLPSDLSPHLDTNDKRIQFLRDRAWLRPALQDITNLSSRVDTSLQQQQKAMQEHPFARQGQYSPQSPEQYGVGQHSPRVSPYRQRSPQSLVHTHNAYMVGDYVPDHMRQMVANPQAQSPVPDFGASRSAVEAADKLVAVLAQALTDGRGGDSRGRPGHSKKSQQQSAREGAVGPARAGSPRTREFRPASRLSPTGGESGAGGGGGGGGGAVGSTPSHHQQQHEPAWARSGQSGPAAAPIFTSSDNTPASRPSLAPHAQQVHGQPSPTSSLPYAPTHPPQSAAHRSANLTSRHASAASPGSPAGSRHQHHHHHQQHLQQQPQQQQQQYLAPNTPPSYASPPSHTQSQHHHSQFNEPSNRPSGLTATLVAPPRSHSAASTAVGRDSADYSLLGIEVADQHGSVIVQSAYPDAPAAIGGMRVGDRIVSFNGTNVTTRVDFLRCLARTRPSQLVPITFVPSNSASSVTTHVVIGGVTANPQTPPRASTDR